MSPGTHFITSPAQAELTGQALCALCAEQGGCCCATDPALGHLSFPLSGAEWARLTPWRALATETGSVDERAPALTGQQADAVADALDASLNATLPAPAALAPSSLDSAALNAALNAALEAAGLNAALEAADLNAALESASPDSSASEAPAAGDACCQPWPNSPEFITSMRALFPQEKDRIEQLFPPGKRHLSLRLRADGTCVFLGGAGCRLPRFARPWYCLLFPAWMTSLGPSLFTAKGCLIAGRARNPAHGIKLMGVDPDEPRAIFAQLRRDWGLESK